MEGGTKSYFSTAEVPPRNRSRLWREVISSAYFPLELEFREPDTFNGQLALWQLGPASLSRLKSAALCYKRRRRHLVEERDEHYLVTVPVVSDVCFSQSGSNIRCGPGGFILERSHEPYEFSYPRANDLWVLKLPDHALRGRLWAPDRYCTMTFDATSGAGGLFVDMLHLIPGRYSGFTAEARAALGQQLADLLVLALKGDKRVLTSNASSVREAHLTRIEAFIRKNLADANLDPDTIAAACGISTRYLHDLFRDINQTLGQWIRDQRLLACRESLCEPNNNHTIAEIAFRWGFSDQALFSRAFKARFGASPKEFRDQQRCSLAE